MTFIISIELEGNLEKIIEVDKVILLSMHEDVFECGKVIFPQTYSIYKFHPMKLSLSN
jgi:hypothetical protein